MRRWGEGEDRTILVFDLGGGTFDTTVIKIVGNDVHVVCTDGNHRLGGADWDDKIADFLLERFMRRESRLGRGGQRGIPARTGAGGRGHQEGAQRDSVAPLPDAFRRRAPASPN